jgi:FkbM family methyltransferase
MKGTDWKVRAARTRQALDEARSTVHGLRRRTLSPEVLGTVLTQRAGSLMRTPAITPPVPRADRVDMYGLTWWVPPDLRREGRLASRTLSGFLDLKAILATREFIDGRGTMIDVGANIGLTAIPRAVLGDFSLVYAIEAHPDNAACLSRNIDTNGLTGRVEATCAAVSDREGQVSLYTSKSIGSHSLAARRDHDPVSVQMVTLDAFARTIEATRTRFIKIDTQGHESHILDGARDMLRRPGIAWQLEVYPRYLRKHGRTVETLIGQLQAAFTTVIDLSATAPGERVRPVADLPEMLAYLGNDAFTDVIAYGTPA